MKLCSSCREMKPLTAFHRHVCHKDGRSSACKPCAIRKAQVWASANRDRNLAKGAAWRAANPNYMKERYQRLRVQELERSKNYRLANPDKVKAATAVWRTENKHKVRQSYRQWLRRNRSYIVARSARRKAIALKACPAWANRFFVDEVYRLAKLRTKMLGFPWHVDHIVPLQSPIVCGLHVEHNLRVIPGAENCRKRNRYWPDMPETIHATT